MRQPLIRRAAVVLGAGVLALPLAGTAAAAPAQRAALPDAAPSWANAAHRTGAPAAAQKLTVQVNLTPRDAAGAEKLAAAVSNPRSADYGHYLTPAQFNQRFAPTAASVTAVRGYLTGAGLTVSGVADGNRWISATGTVSQLESAFGTKLSTYTYRGRSLRAPAGKVTVPASVAPAIQGVTGLADRPAPAQPTHVAAASDAGPAGPAATPPAGQCSNFWGEHHVTMPAAYGQTEIPTAGCGKTPDQLQIGYDVKSPIVQGRDGHGTTVAILDAYASDTMKADADRYSSDNAQPVLGKGQYSEKTFTPFDMQDVCGDWGTEEHIDVDAVHAMAPGAKILYVGAKNCDTGLDDALNWIVQHKAANMVSNSWANHGEDVPVGTLQREHGLFVQGAAEGIGMYFASGDWGDEVTLGNTPSAQPDYPASDPSVTGVGGTSLALGSDFSYQFETGWGNNLDRVDWTKNPPAYTAPLPGAFSSGAGGGVSTLFDQPDYQVGVVPDALSRPSGGDAARVVPDVSALADPETGMAVGITTNGVYALATWGGTSLACPLFVGLQADASTGRGTAIGFANPLLYSLHGTSAYHDVVPQHTPTLVASVKGSWTMTMDHDTSLATGYGYDTVTGVGSPVGRRLVAAENR